MKILRGGDAKPWYFTALEATPPPNLVCGIFEGGDAKPWYFTALEHPPQKRSTVEVGFSENLQRPGVEVRRGHTRFAFLIYVYPPDIS